MNSVVYRIPSDCCLRRIASRLLALFIISLCLILYASVSRADVFEWDYIDPANPALGKKQSTRRTPSGAGISPGPGLTYSPRNLTKAYLEHANLTGSIFSYTNLTNASLRDANLTNAALAYTFIENADFTGATVRGANFTNAYYFTPEQLYSTASYQAGDLTGIVLDWTFFPTINLAGQNLTNASLVSMSVGPSDFSHVNLTNARCTAMNFPGVNLRDATLVGADFSGSVLTGADLTNADIRAANFSAQPVWGTAGLTFDQLASTHTFQAHELSGMDFSFSDFSGGSFVGQDLTHVNFAGVKFSNIDFTDADVRHAVLGGIGTDGLTLAQIYSTASYRNKDLAGILLRGNLAGANFAGQNLSNAELSGADAANANFANANLTNVSLWITNLSGANLAGATIRGADLNHTGITATQLYSTASYTARDLSGISIGIDADLSGWNFANQNLENAIFDFATLASTPFNNSVIRGASFIGVTPRGFIPTQFYSTASYQSGDLTGINLGGNNLSGWNFANKNLANAVFEFNSPVSGATQLIGALFDQSNLSKANFLSCDLSGASFRNANLADADFSGATLTNTDFTGADIRGANLLYATMTPDQLFSTSSFHARDLTGTAFGGAYLGVNLSGFNLANAKFQGELNDANLSGANLSGATMSSAWLLRANLRQTNLTNAALDYAALTNADLRDANLTNANLQRADLTDADLRGVTLTNASLAGATLTGANMTGMNIAGTDFAPVRVYSSSGGGGIGGPFEGVLGPGLCGHWVGGCHPPAPGDPSVSYGTGITPAQLYTTASYQARNLTNVNLSGHNFDGADLTNQNLTNSYFVDTTFVGATLAGADARGATGLNLSQATATNLIRSNGRISGLQVDSGESLLIRDYDGNPFLNTAPIAIRVEQRFVMNSGGELLFALESDAWNSTISFTANVPVSLGGSIELLFADGTDLDEQIARTFRLFNWSGVSPTGVFEVSSPYTWNLSKLYTTGEVTLVSLFAPGDANGDGQVNRADAAMLARGFGIASGAQWSDGDFDGNGRVDMLDLSILQSSIGASSLSASAVPEPPAQILVAMACLFVLARLRRPWMCRTLVILAARFRTSAIAKLVVAPLIIVALASPAAADRFRILHSFSGDDGGGPLTEVTIDGATLYGTTGYGGPGGYGNVYKMNLDGTAFEVLHNFTSGYYPSYNPVPAVVVSNGVIYGSTTVGEHADSATLYRLNTDGSAFRVLYRFPVGVTGPGDPSPLILSGTTLYGSTTGICCAGNTSGAVFKLNIDGSDFEYLHTFTGMPVPLGGVSLSGSTLYGTTREGGSSGRGTIFKIEINGTGFASYSMPADERAGAPQSGVLVDGSMLYGTSYVYSGDYFTYGSAFRLKSDGSEFEFIHRFPSDPLGDGTYPVSGLTRVGSKLFGTTASGSRNGWGIIYSMDLDGSDYEILHRFRYAPDNAFSSWAKLTYQGGVLYGTTLYGGDNGTELGTVFALSIPEDLAETRFDEPLSGSSNYAPADNAGEWGFTTTRISTGGANAFTGVNVLDGQRVFSHRSTHATTRFSAVDLEDFNDIEISVDMSVANTAYETGDFVHVYATNGSEIVSLIDADGAGTEGLDYLAQRGFETYSATIPAQWSTAWLVIESFSNSSQGAERFDFDNIFFTGVAEPVPEPATLILAMAALGCMAFIGLRCGTTSSAMALTP